MERKDKFRMAAMYIDMINIIDSDDENEVKRILRDDQTFMANYSFYLEKDIRKKSVEALVFFMLIVLVGII